MSKPSLKQLFAGFMPRVCSDEDFASIHPQSQWPMSPRFWRMITFVVYHLTVNKISYLSTQLRQLSVLISFDQCSANPELMEGLWAQVMQKSDY